MQDAPPCSVDKPRRPALAFAVALAWALASNQSAMAACEDAVESIALTRCQCTLRPQDEIWLVSTRHLSLCPSCGAPPVQLRYHRYDEHCGFQPATAEEYFAAADPQAIVTVYVHGNRISTQLACQRGLRMYRMLATDACPSLRIRHVIWSWPSSQIPGPAHDVREKAARTPLQSYYLAYWLQQQGCETRVSLLGFSYGARTIVGALHLLGGGELCGRRLPACGHGPQSRAVLWAAALPGNWLLPGGFNGCAMSAVNRMLVVRNAHDPALRRYPRYVRDGRGRALGYRGLARPRRLGCDAVRLDQLDATCIVGRRHDWQRHVDSAVISYQTRRYALWTRL